MIAQQCSQRIEQRGFAAWTVIIAQRFRQLAIVMHLLQKLLKIVIHCRNLRRITAAQHNRTGRAQAFTHVFH